MLSYDHGSSSLSAGVALAKSRLHPTNLRKVTHGIRKFFVGVSSEIDTLLFTFWDINCFIFTVYLKFLTLSLLLLMSLFRLGDTLFWCFLVLRGVLLLAWLTTIFKTRSFRSLYFLNNFRFLFRNLHGFLWKQISKGKTHLFFQFAHIFLLFQFFLFYFVCFLFCFVLSDVAEKFGSCLQGRWIILKNKQVWSKAVSNLL